MKYSGIEWIGEIPEDWRTLPLKRLIKNHFSGCWGEEADREDFNALCIRIADFNFNDQTIKLTASTIRSYSKTQLDKGVLSDGDLLLEKSGGGDKTPVGRTVIFRQKDFPDKTMFANFCECLRLVDSVCKKYIAYVLKALYISCDMRCFFYQTTGLQNIDLKVFLSTILCLPNGATQHKIANFLDVKCAEIDKLIANQQEQIDKLKEYKQSVITEAVTKGLDPSVPMKDSGVEWIGQIPQSWEVVRLKFLLNSPMQYGANESGQLYDEKCVRYIRITDITQNGTLKNDDVLYLPLEKAVDYILKDKDVLFARSGATVGKTFLFKSRFGKSAFAGYLIKADCDKEKLVPEYLMYFTQSKIYNLWKQMIFIQSTIQNIGASKYENMQVVVPNIETQQQIADYLDDKCGKIDQLIAIKQQKIDKLQQYKKSLIYEYVTGKKEVI